MVPMVMVHGIGRGSSVLQYRLNAQAVAAAGHRVYVLDLLRFGRSSQPAQRITQDALVPDAGPSGPSMDREVVDLVRMLRAVRATSSCDPPVMHRPPITGGPSPARRAA
jgi:pimeloyl-ACP methyl ester carboxylesterase